MKSREVSFMPPLKPLVKGVRMASVMTTSSAFFCVLLMVISKYTFGGESGVHCRYSAFAWGKVTENRTESFRCHD